MAAASVPTPFEGLERCAKAHPIRLDKHDQAGVNTIISLGTQMSISAMGLLMTILEIGLSLNVMQPVLRGVAAFAVRIVYGIMRLKSLKCVQTMDNESSDRMSAMCRKHVERIFTPLVAIYNEEIHTFTDELGGVPGD